MIGVDMKAWFVPSFLNSEKLTPAEKKAATVMGTVVYVNYAHKVFMVEFDANGETFKESFKFCDCGKAVTVRG